jgi:hypothetical protein
MNKRLNYLLLFLHKKGYKTGLDLFGNIKFKQNESLYYIKFSDDNQQYYQLVKLNIWHLEKHYRRHDVWQIIDHTNKKIPVARVTLVPGYQDVMASVDYHCSTPKEFVENFLPLSELVNYIENEFLQEINLLNNQKSSSMIEKAESDAAIECVPEAETKKIPTISKEAEFIGKVLCNSCSHSGYLTQKNEATGFILVCEKCGEANWKIRATCP